VRLTPKTDTVPASINKYLLPHERQVITVKYHPAIVIPPAATATGGLFAAVAVNPLVKNSPALKLTIWLLAGLLCLRFISACINWSARWFIVTSQRILLVSGALSTRVRNIPLEDIKHMTFRRSRGSRTLGYGAFILDTGGSPYIIVDYIPYPEQLYLEVTGLVFRDREESPD
jgi:hypothetical protein